jgi:predicted glycosyltransferase
MKKILVYSHDTFGLGNIRRMLAISKHLVDADPDVSVLILTGSPMLHAFRIPPRVDYVKLPCLARTREGAYTVKFLPLRYQDAVKLRSNLILSTVLDFQPDLILVDKKPLGVANELAATLDVVQRRADRPKLVLLLRDILDAPEATTSVWKKNGHFDAVEAFYDQVLVVGSPEIFDVRRQYQFPRACADKVRFCGYIARERGIRSRVDLRAQLGVKNAPLVLVSAGGGEDGFELLSSYLSGLTLTPQAQPVVSLLLCGPEMSEAQRASLHAAVAQHANVRIQDFTDDMMSYLDAADLAVSMGGYNTVCEILTLKKRAIIVPRVKPVQEQWIRAARMAELGLLTTIHPLQLTPKRLLNTVLQELDRDNVYPRGLYQIDLNGLREVQRHISGLLDGRAQTTAARLRFSELPREHEASL